MLSPDFSSLRTGHPVGCSNGPEARIHGFLSSEVRVGDQEGEERRPVLLIWVAGSATSLLLFSEEVEKVSSKHSWD